MEELRDVKQIVRHPGHELTHLLVVIEGKGKLLVMLEDLITHPIFHPGAHHVAPIGDVEIADQLQDQKSQHQNA